MRFVRIVKVLIVAATLVVEHVVFVVVLLGVVAATFAVERVEVVMTFRYL